MKIFQSLQFTDDEENGIRAWHGVHILQNIKLGCVTRDRQFFYVACFASEDVHLSPSAFLQLLWRM